MPYARAASKPAIKTPDPARVRRLRGSHVSLRTKIILALLLSSLASVGLVGGVAYYELMRKFDDRMLQESFNRFQGDVVAYEQAYGSWSAAQDAQHFGEFV